MAGEDREYVLRRAKELDVKFIRFWFTDILGSLKSFSITVEELEKALDEGMGFDGSSIEGFARIDESDMLAVPDPSTFVLLPWRPRERHTVARMFCDILTPDHKPFEGDPRYVLKRNLERAAAMGYNYYVGPELEYFYFKSAEGAPEPLDHGGYFDLTPLDMASDLRRDTVLTLEEMGIAVEYSHHEVAPSQHEIDLRYTDALTMADNAMTYRLVVKQIALNHDVYATFMPKPLMGENGSGMHVHQSLFSGGRNAFHDPNGSHFLSETALHFIAGLLKHAPAITAVTSQWVNSYKRLVPGYEAPTYITWGRTNRSALIRVPMISPGRSIEGTRAEVRCPDPSSNTYLAFAAMVAAGLDGVEKGLTLAAPVEESLFEMDAATIASKAIKELPGTLGEALDELEKDEVIREALGDHVYGHFIEAKRAEWDEYRMQVSDWEVERYLDQF